MKKRKIKKKYTKKIENIINYIKENRKTIILIISSFLFIYITYAIFNDKITKLDTNIHSYILSIRNETLTNTLILITNISSAYSLIVLSIILLASIKNKKTTQLI